MKLRNKITPGFMVQGFDEHDRLISQEFIAGDEVTWEDESGNPLDDQLIDHPLDTRAELLEWYHYINIDEKVREFLARFLNIPYQTFKELQSRREKKKTSPELERFLEAYQRLSKLGKCDMPGGAEYDRVKMEWIEAGKPDNLDEFITQRANSL